MKKFTQIKFILLFILGPILAPAIEANQSPVVFLISGVAGSDFSHLGEAFTKQGLDFQFVPGKWGGRVHERAIFSKDYIQNYLGESHRPCVVIGHSYGGMVARVMIQEYLKTRCQLFISSTGAQRSSPWANYVKGVSLKAPGRLPEHLLAQALSHLISDSLQAPSPLILNVVAPFFGLVRLIPSLNEKLINWEGIFLEAMEDLEKYKLPDHLEASEMEDFPETIGFMFFQKKPIHSAPWPWKWGHKFVWNLSRFLNNLSHSESLPKRQDLEEILLNDGIIPTQSMAFGQETYCLESSHFNAMHPVLYQGKYDVRNQLLETYAALIAYKLNPGMEEMKNWDKARAQLVNCPMLY